jgi:low affinity Fe/Cu permease
VKKIFHAFAQHASNVVGSPWTFFAAVLVTVAWAFTGPIFGYSDSWQLVINTGTTIVTFLMVFLIQNTQNRDSNETRLKLNELIRAHGAARNRLMALEDCTDEELAHLTEEFKKLRERAREGRTAEERD